MKFFKKQLSNGITVIGELRDLPVVSMSITNKFGAAHEYAEIKGIAHLIEHLLFTGTKKRTHEEISREIEKRGGVINAFTSDSVTSFWFKLPSEHVFAGLDILVDMLKNPLFEEKKFEKEKRVVLEEIKMYHDSPQHHVYEKITENLYEKPLGIGVIGTTETIKSLKRDFVANYFKEKYSPENYIVTFVGKIDVKKLCDYLEKEFRKQKKTSAIIPIIKRNEKTLERRPGLDQAHYIFATHAPLAGTKEAYALEVLDAYLANGMSSKLFLSIREEHGLAYAVKSMIESSREYGYYTVYVGTTKESIEQVEKLILQGFQEAKKLTEKELQEAKQRLIGLKQISKEESASVMNELMNAEFCDKAENYYRYEQEIKKVTLEEVRKQANITSFSTAAIIPA